MQSEEGILTISDLLELDLNVASIDNYDRAFAFLKIKDLPSDAYERKKRYIAIYRSHIFLVSAIFPIICSVFISALVWFVIISIGVNNPSEEQFRVASLFWPWNLNEVAHLRSYTATVTTNSPDMADLLLYMSACSITSLSWLMWFLWRIYKDVNDRYVFMPSGVDGLFRKKLFAISVVIFLEGVFLVFMATLTLSESAVLLLPSLSDSLFVYTAKKCAYISVAYWSFGVSFLLLSMIVRGTCQQQKAKER